MTRPIQASLDLQALKQADVYAVECFNAAFIPKSWSVK